MKTKFKTLITTLLLGVVIITGSKGSKGQSVYSHMPKTAMVQFKVYPNPSAGQMNVAVENLPAGSIKLILTDMNGKEWISKVVEHLEEGVFYENIDAEDIPDGIYKIKIIHNDYIIIKKWTKGL